MGGGVDGMPPNLPIAGAFGQGGAFVRAFNVLKDRQSMGTETIESVRAKDRGERGARTKRQGFMSGGERGKRAVNHSKHDSVVLCNALDNTFIREWKRVKERKVIQLFHICMVGWQTPPFSWDGPSYS